MQKSPVSALFSAMAGSLLVMAATHLVARLLTTNTRVILTADVLLGGVLFTASLLASRTLFKNRPALDYWVVGTAAIFCGAAIASYTVTNDFSFVIAASAVTFSASLASLFRDVDERVKGSILLFGYMCATSLAYLLAAS